jgi:SagB-type dehydrogenase family enzyme
MIIKWSTLMVLIGAFFASAVFGQDKPVIKLPSPSHKGTVTVEEALKKRRTVRQFDSRPLDLNQISQLLWGAYGVSEPRGFRTAPSAGATFPLELYLVVGERGAADLAAGVYRYQPLAHTLEATGAQGDLRGAVARASLHQSWMAQAPVMVLFAAEYQRCTARYGNRGIQYTHMEVGHAGQNLFLQAGALGLACGIVGAFHDQHLAQTLKLPAHHEPLLVMPVGYGR